MNIRAYDVFHQAARQCKPLENVHSHSPPDSKINLERFGSSANWGLCPPNPRSLKPRKHPSQHTSSTTLPPMNPPPPLPPSQSSEIVFLNPGPQAAPLNPGLQTPAPPPSLLESRTTSPPRRPYSLPKPRTTTPPPRYRTGLIHRRQSES